MKATTPNDAAMLAALNPNLKTTVKFYRKNAWKFPLWRISFPKKLCREMAPLLKRIRVQFGLGKVEAQTVLVDLLLQRALGGKVAKRVQS